ncbi:Lar family restriction alleviation protein [Stenotrophomonas sp. PSU_St142]
MEEIELKLCPFCGASGEMLVIEHMDGTILHPAYRVRCEHCGASSRYTDHDCREAWNTRAALSPAEGYVEAPEDPSLAMTAAGQLFGLTPNQACAVYQSMLAARPKMETP